MNGHAWHQNGQDGSSWKMHSATAAAHMPPGGSRSNRLPCHAKHGLGRFHRRQGRPTRGAASLDAKQTQQDTALLDGAREHYIIVCTQVRPRIRRLAGARTGLYAARMEPQSPVTGPASRFIVRSRRRMRPRLPRCGVVGLVEGLLPASCRWNYRREKAYF